ncbi:MAG: methyltransferase domain-containing protein [Planctomycetota bacterium]|nr:methyltransferase domain-containing protein [Planctomycetota bacterium]
MTDQDYILGTEEAEIARLRTQHASWTEYLAPLVQDAGLRPGQRWVDLGSGPGFTTFDLAQLVGAEGEVVAVDESARFLAFLDAEKERRDLGWIRTQRTRVEELDLEEASCDGAYSRWLFSWLEDPSDLLRRAARFLKPGGVLVCQEYLHWSAMKLLPPSAAFDRGVEACMRSWTTPINIAEDLPRLAAEVGLEVVTTRPVARIGGPGSLEWRWIGGFFEIYLPKLIARGLLTGEEWQAWQAAWRARSEDPVTRALAPIMLDLVLRKPA